MLRCLTEISARSVSGRSAPHQQSAFCISRSVAMGQGIGDRRIACTDAQRAHIQKARNELMAMIAAMLGCAY
jgi:hypothetical protein